MAVADVLDTGLRGFEFGFPEQAGQPILTTARYTHLTSHTNDQASVRINALMDRFAMTWGAVK